MSDTEPRRPRVLLADDHLFIHSVLSTRLEREFDMVATATDAEQAIALAAEHQPDVAIIDVQMPQGGGLHAARGIRAGSPSTAIVALSADESRQGVLDMLDAGAILYLRKDCPPEELSHGLHRAITAHRP